MKKSIFLSVILFVSVFTINAQNNTMYIMKDGEILRQYNVNTDLDSIIFYKPTIDTSGTFTDTRDNRVYKWVRIGDQLWMAENLKYLPSVIGPTTCSYIIPYFYVYDYYGTVVADAKATANYTIYGVLYNWPAAMNGASSSTTNPSGVQGICPYGWHLPSDAEWTELTDYLGGVDAAAEKIKDTILWNNPNDGTTNETGFSALPAGSCEYDWYNSSVFFDDLGDHAHWWCATQTDIDYAWSRRIHSDWAYILINGEEKEMGYSVRCVKD